MHVNRSMHAHSSDKIPQIKALSQRPDQNQLTKIRLCYRFSTQDRRESVPVQNMKRMCWVLCSYSGKLSELHFAFFCWCMFVKLNFFLCPSDLQCRTLWDKDVPETNILWAIFKNRNKQGFYHHEPIEICFSWDVGSLLWEQEATPKVWRSGGLTLQIYRYAASCCSLFAWGNVGRMCMERQTWYV